MTANRSRDWFKQALHDRQAAQQNADIGIHDWACFMAQQSAEKALKALVQYGGATPGAIPCVNSPRCSRKR
jgi:HEPN domain-containing protein